MTLEESPCLKMEGISDELDSLDSEESSSEESSAMDSSDSEDEVSHSSVSSYSLVHNEAVSLQKNYINKICGCNSLSQFAIASSDFSVSVYDSSQLRKLSEFSGHSDTVSCIRYHPREPYQLYSSSTDGTIRLWDTRKAGECVNVLKDDLADSGRLKPFLSFNISKSGNFLCAGSELFEGDAFLDFWDNRSSKLLGGYWESHSDDITQVCFHPALADIVVSASTDGLINVYDISQETEEDALLNCLNTESSVDIIRWHSLNGIVKGLTCITGSRDIQVWDRDGSAPVASFSRADVSKQMKAPASDTDLIDIHCTNDGNILLLAGANKKTGFALSIVEVNKEHLNLKAHLPGSKPFVRCSWLNEEEKYVIVGGESGILSKWQLKDESTNTSFCATQLKVKARLSQTRSQPY